MPSAIPTSPPTVPIPLKISADDMTIAYDDPTAWNVTAAPAVVSVALSLRSTEYVLMNHFLLSSTGQRTRSDQSWQDSI